jgi:hypothetical protein
MVFCPRRTKESLPGRSAKANRLFDQNIDIAARRIEIVSQY